MKPFFSIIWCAILLLLFNEANAQITAAFNYTTPGDSCMSRNVQFDASASSGTIDTYDWEFSNHESGASIGTGSGKKVTRNFLTPGIFDVILTVKGGGTTASKSAQIRVYKEPEPDFSAIETEGCPPLTIKLTDKSKSGDGTIVKWEWNYNDGKSNEYTTPFNPDHIYTAAGNYTPTLIITNSAGCTKSLSKDQYIKVYDQITPGFLVTNNFSCDTPKIVNFENISPATSSFNFIWDFGDNTSDTVNNVLTTHTYNKPGIYTIQLSAVNSPGNCSNKVQSSGATNVYIGKPIAAFSLQAKMCLGTSTYIYPDTDTTGISNEGKWFFEDDKTVVNGKTSYHTFLKEGKWKVKFVTFNTYSGCYSDTCIKEVEILPSPVADFVADNPDGCKIPHTVKFKNSSLNAEKYEWIFGDGQTAISTDQTDTSHTYSSFGSFQVQLKATNVGGCTTEKSLNYIRINQPSLDFDYSPNEGCLPLTIEINAKPSSIDVPVKFIYNYGNGKADTTISATQDILYDTEGNFTLSMEIITAQGCSAKSMGKMLQVNKICDDDGSSVGSGDGGGSGGAPISIGRNSNCNSKYSFTMEDTARKVVISYWDLDGVRLNTSDKIMEYTFPRDGIKKKFIITVSGTDTSTNTVTEYQKRIIVIDEKADFTADRMNICKGLTVNFETTGIDSSNIKKYTWAFGDTNFRKTIDNSLIFKNTGKYSNGNISYTYQDTGVFYPKLIIEDKFGCEDSVRLPEPVVVKGPQAFFSTDTANSCNGKFAVHFSDSSKANGTTPIKEWNWNFGDGVSRTSGKDSAITHNYLNNTYYALYKATLKITDELGCTDKAEHAISSYNPKAAFTSNDTLRCGVTNISFYNQSNALVSNPANILWKYGNDETSTGYNGAHNFADTGSFTITLIVKDDGGCIDSISKNGYVKLVKPRADFSVGKDTAKCVGTFSLPFVSTSTYSNSFTWDFGDGESSSTDKIEVSHYYKVAGTYNVKLAVSGLDGCKDTLIKKVKIKGPFGELKTDDTYICLGDSFPALVQGGNIKEYFWDFGDFSSTNELNTSGTVIHYYTKPGKYLPTLILLSPEGCQITLSAKDSIVVDNIDAGPPANIPCGETHTILRGTAAINSGKYIWEGPSGADFIPNNESLTTSVNIAGLYILKFKNGECKNSDSVEVTSLGIVPDAFAGTDSKIDCLSGVALLEGHTTTANTSFRWTGPQNAIFGNSDSALATSVNLPGIYLLTITQKFCTSTDTIVISDCTLNPQDTVLKICANVPGIPPRFTGYPLVDLDAYVKGNVPSAVSWFTDPDFIDKVNNPEGIILTDNGQYFARIISNDGTETARAKVTAKVYEYVKTNFDDIPEVCEGSDIFQVSGAFPTSGIFSGAGISAEGKFIPKNPGSYEIQYWYISSEGCKDSITKTAVVLDVPATPLVEDTIEYCQDILLVPVLVAQAAQHNTLQWYLSETSVERFTVPPLLDRHAGIESIYVSQKNHLCESKRARIVAITDTTPVQQSILSLSPICEGSTRTIGTRGLPGSTFEWTIDGGADFSYLPSYTDSLRFTAGKINIKGKVAETSARGCKSNSLDFQIQVDLQPSSASVNGKLRDTISYCMVATGKHMTADRPVTGTGVWKILKNTANASIATITDPESEIIDFENLGDTLTAVWGVSNGVCPISKAVLTVVPEIALVPEVSISAPDTVCEGTDVLFTATPGAAAGNSPNYYFYSGNQYLPGSGKYSSELKVKAVHDTVIYVKMRSDETCLVSDTGRSGAVKLHVVKKPIAKIQYNYDSTCITNVPIILSPVKNIIGNLEYEWYRPHESEKLPTNGGLVLITQAKASGKYILKVYNSDCPPVYDTIDVKIYEEPMAYFTENIVNIDYAPEKYVQLPFQLEPLQDSSDKINIQWNPTFALYTEPDWPLNELQAPMINIEKPYFKAQNEEISNTYTALVSTGPPGKGCATSVSILINNFKPLNIPNVFSPNNDGLNDLWIIDGLTKYSTTSIRVFNRWGSLLYENKDGYNQPWDGTCNGARVPAGTYYYMIDLSGGFANSGYVTSGWLLVIE